MNKFVLRKLVVDKACGDKLKILEPGKYVFSDAKYDAFFVESVAIQAVVGKNGCGKSTLIEMLFRMSNNLAALMLRGYERPAAEQIYYIKNVVADLYYELDGAQGVLRCKKNGVELTVGEHSFAWSISSEECVYKLNGRIIKEPRFPMEAKAASLYFYTIATNYSMQSYIANDYADESIMVWNKKKKKWENEFFATSWIDGIFHKNDGYMSPIVLNPYRHEGNIDMAKEEWLTTNRLCSILWETKDLPEKEQLIEGYKLAELKYDFYNQPLMKKFNKKAFGKFPKGSFSGHLVYAYKQNGSIAKSILDAYGLMVNARMSEIDLTLRIYLAYKTLSIAKKYPSYSNFKRLGNVDLVFASSSQAYYHTKSKELVDKILKDPSHITLKIRQTLELIKILLNQPHKKFFEGRFFTYDNYLKLMGEAEEPVGLLKRMDLLPPPIFRPHIYLNAFEDTKKININHLSSGERQFIYLTSTLVYHAMNLQSIPDDGTRVKYTNINMVLDEIEICFHPEYQRTFINKFLDLLKRTNLTSYFGINVLVVTHSPFVLSDIPQGNIMYLKKGHQLTRDELDGESITNPFCANINDILHQSFFLEKGFVGEFAKKRVLSLVDYLKRGNNVDDWNPETARLFIEEIGEPMVREQLLGLYSESKETSAHDKIVLYEEEIRRLRIEGK